MPTDHSYYKQPLDYEDILYEVDAPLARITLNRPERMNALRNTLRGELFPALRAAAPASASPAGSPPRICPKSARSSPDRPSGRATSTLATSSSGTSPKWSSHRP